MKKKKEMEKQLAELKHKYEEIIHSAIDGIFIKDLSGRYRLINAAAARTVGKRIKDFIGKTDFSVFPKNLAEIAMKEDRKVIRTKKAIKSEQKFVCAGKEFYFEVIKHPITDKSDKPIFVCGIVRDVTGWKKNEEALRDSVKELSALYRISKDIDRIKKFDVLFKDIARISRKAMNCPDSYFIIWLFDERGKKQIKAFRGVKNKAEARRFLLRKSSFNVSLKVRGKQEGSFVAGYKDSRHKISREEKQFIREITELTGKDIERRKIKEDLDRMFIEVVKSFSSALDARDHYTVDHSKRISESCRLIAERLNLKNKEKGNLALGALLHDIGKIGISDGILAKPTTLTPEEFDKVKQHPLISEKILKPIEALKGSLKIIRHHHERYDGKGYPDGLKDKKIPLGARILAVCDAYDAMVSERPYRTAMSVHRAVAELKKNLGTQFDPRIAKIMIYLIEKRVFR